MRKGWRRRSPAVLLAATVLAAAASAAGPVDKDSKRDPAGDVKAAGLRAAERAALDIVRVGVTAAPSLVHVRVELRGNFERAIGRGGLKNAFPGIVLTPKQGKPTAFVTTGPGTRGMIATVGPGRGLAAREGRTLRFVLSDVRGQVEAVVAKTLAEAPPRRSRRIASAGQQVDQYLAFLANLIASRPGTDSAVLQEVSTIDDPVGFAKVVFDVDRASCEETRAQLNDVFKELEGVRAELKRAQAEKRSKEVARLYGFADALHLEIEYLEVAIDSKCNQPPPPPSPKPAKPGAVTLKLTPFLEWTAVERTDGKGCAAGRVTLETKTVTLDPPTIKNNVITPGQWVEVTWTKRVCAADRVRAGLNGRFFSNAPAFPPGFFGAGITYQATLQPAGAGGECFLNKTNNPAAGCPYQIKLRLQNNRDPVPG